MNLPDIFNGEPTKAKWAALGRYLQEFSIRGGPNVRVRQVGGSFIITASRGSGGSVVAEQTSCPFGAIVRYTDGETEKTGIQGGVIVAGTSTYNIPNREINLTADGTWLVYFALDATANTDDDGELLLPGLVEATAQPAWALTSGDTYPAGTAPTASSPTGTIILPVGVLTVTDGSATLVPTGCGGFTVDHCAGTLSYIRQ